MTSDFPSATTYAHDVVARHGELSWRDLERGQLAGRPAVGAALDATYDLLDRPAGRDGVGLGLLAVIAEFIPVIALGVLVSALRLDVAYLAGALIAVGVLSLGYVVVQAAHWRDAAWRGSASLGVLAVVSALSGAITVVLAVLAIIARGESVGIVAAATAIAAGLMTAAAVVTVVLVRRRARQTATPASSYDALHAELAGLTDDDRAQLRADLESATAILVDGGALDADVRVDALAVPLGGLGRWAWARDERDRRAAA